MTGAHVTRRRLAVGDYGLFAAERLRAVVERKSFDNLLADVGAVQALHQQLADLASAPRAALVIKADYRDFLDPDRLKGRWPAAHLARVLGEVAALHPTLPIIYAGNRKLANAWTLNFFLGVAARDAGPEPQLALDVAGRYDAALRAPGLDDAVRRAARHELRPPFAFAELVVRFPGVRAARVRRLLAQLRQEGRIRRIGAGRGARWVRL